MKLLIKEAAEYLNISKEAIYNRIRRGTLQSIKENNTTYVIIEENNSLNNKDLLEKIKELENQNNELKQENEILKQKINLPILFEQKWLLLEDYLNKFKKKKREKVKEYLFKRIGKSKKIKIENNKIYIKNKKLSRI